MGYPVRSGMVNPTVEAYPPSQPASRTRSFQLVWSMDSRDTSVRRSHGYARSVKTSALPGPNDVDTQ